MQIHLPHDETSATIKEYVLGFVFSLLLTLCIFFVITQHILEQGIWVSDMATLSTCITLTILQACVQLYYFLHLGKERSPHRRILTALYAILIISIVVGGSLWIMSNLNYNMMKMSPNTMDTYMIDQ
jgi:cytochrome o ubiquinol oxidase subunit IV